MIQCLIPYHLREQVPLTKISYSRANVCVIHIIFLKIHLIELGLAQKQSSAMT